MVRPGRPVRPARPAQGAARVALTGIPFDANSSFRRGPARAPAAVRKALFSAAGNHFSERGECVLDAGWFKDAGDLRVPPSAASRGSMDLIERHAAALLATDHCVLAIGGDHSVSHPLLRAAAARHGPLSVLHFDAHPDLYPDYEGNRHSHACPFLRALEDGCIAELVQVGIRSSTPDELAAARMHGVTQHRARDLHEVLSVRFRNPLYVSVDIDGLDPAFAPGVSHPVPGGLSPRELLQWLDRATAPRWVCADVVELNPRTDPGGATAVVAARLVKELALLLHQRG